MERSAGSDEELEDQPSPDDQLIRNSSKGPSKEQQDEGILVDLW